MSEEITTTLRRPYVLHVIVSLRTGGAELALASLIEKIGKDRQSHRVVTLSSKLGSEKNILDRLRHAGADVTCLPKSKFFSFLGTVAKLRRLIRAESPDVVHGWMHHGNLAATIATFRRTKSKHIWAIHQSFNGFSYEKLSARVGIRLAAWLSGRPNKIIYVSSLSAAQHAAIGFNETKAVLITNGVDCDRFRPDEEAGQRLRKELGLPEHHPVVGLVARYHPMKDHSLFLEAAAEVLKITPEAHFVLVGSNIESSNLELYAKVEEKGLTDKVHLLGNRLDMESVYNSFDIVVLSSRWGEAFPLVLCEAMACGVPCVSTDVGDCASIIGDSDRVVPPADSKALALAIIRILSLDPSDREKLKDGVRRRVVSKFGIDTMAQKYLELYDEVACG